MPKRLTLQPHLSIDQLKQRYRKALDPVEKSHYQILWLLAPGKTTAKIRQVTGYSINWIRTLIRRYNQLGVEGVKDSRHENPGAETLLDDVLLSQLLCVLQSPPADGGLWNGRKVAEWMSQVLGRKVSRQRGWEYLRCLELRLRVPRPEHEQSDPLEQEAWKKKLAMPVAQIQPTHPAAKVEIWAMDQHRTGLIACNASRLDNVGISTSRQGGLGL
jgi:transposase